MQKVRYGRISKTKEAWKALFLQAYGREPTPEETSHEHFNDKEDLVTKESKRKIEELLRSRKAEKNQ